MTDDDMLFQLGDEPEAQAAAAQPAAAWQIEQLRTALDTLGMTEMSERQRVVEELVGHPITALKELTYDEVRPLLEGLHARKAASPTSSTSAWDDRDEDTWIDRL
ncbi:hypothetical protein AB0F44_02700 [Nocardioides sp. NPDC023903]|uniref:hypothetical protein n=1 Tax=Nocardioides sp. NPDC023903 TaxID=3157195 RepID=UPI0033D627CB